jgi:hypothetical protein
MKLEVSQEMIPSGGRKALADCILRGINAVAGLSLDALFLIIRI